MSSQYHSTGAGQRLHLTVLMEPVGKGRARVVRRGAGVSTYTPDKTVNAENVIRETWAAHGRVRLPDGPLGITVLAYWSRPDSHYLRDGSLSAAGRRAIPGGKIDADNVLKLVGDALNNHAWGDDRMIVHAMVLKLFAERDTPPSVVILAEEMTGEMT